MENKEQITIAKIISNSNLKGSLYSTLRCSYCGKKLVASALGEQLCLECEDHNDYKSYIDNNGKQIHDTILLDLKEIAAILNYNPIDLHHLN